ncbi:MAG: hypothetical protein V3T83_15035 [Acidobacteriota bacterium]
MTVPGIWIFGGRDRNIQVPESIAIPAVLKITIQLLLFVFNLDINEIHKQRRLEMSKKIFALLLAAAIFAGFAVITDGLVAGSPCGPFAPADRYCDAPTNCCPGSVFALVAHAHGNAGSFARADRPSDPSRRSPDVLHRSSGEKR